MSKIYSNLVARIGLPLTSSLSSSRFWKIYQQLDNRQAAFDMAEVPKRLEQLVKHAQSEVPFYTERLQALEPSNVQKTFSSIPPLTKQEIVQNFPDRITSRTKIFSPWRYASTSGTLERMTVIHDFRKRDYIRATQLYSMKLSAGYKPGYRYLEIPPDICTNVCGVSDSAEPSLLSFLLESIKSKNLFEKDTISTLKGLIERQIVYRRLQLTSFSGNGFVQKSEDLDTYLESIKSYSPHTIKALPVYLYILARYIKQRGDLTLPLAHSALMPMGASLTPHMKLVIEQGFGVQVHEDYGSAELGSIGSECGEKSGIHIFEGLFKVEVVRHGKAALPGEVGRVLVTDLYNYAMPLIRYDIGDVAEVQPGNCACGRNGLRLVIKGRLKDCLFDRNESIFTGDDITDMMLGLPGVAAFQIESRNHRINLSVLPDEQVDCDLKQVEAALAAVISQRYRIRARIVSTIMPEASGKYRFVKNLDDDINGAI